MYKCPKLTEKLQEILNQKNQEIANIENEIKQLKIQLQNEQDSIEYFEDISLKLKNRENKINKYKLRLESAFQFADYKYTKADIVIYDEAIKVLDTFAGEYIKEWLSSLSIILNNLLNKLNIKIEFTADKDFIRVFDNGQVLKYEQLSTGQKCFLNVVFKLAILLQQNKSGMVLMDDGLNNLDSINLTNLITICSGLPFQIIAVYQSKIEIEGVKQFLVTREKGESNVHTMDR